MIARGQTHRHSTSSNFSKEKKKKEKKEDKRERERKRDWRVTRQAPAFVVVPLPISRVTTRDTTRNATQATGASNGNQ